MANDLQHHQAINEAVRSMAQYLHDKFNLDVQIIATHYGKTGTSIHCNGYGNFYARKAACSDWLLAEDVETQCSIEDRLDAMADDGEDEDQQPIT